MCSSDLRDPKSRDLIGDESPRRPCEMRRRGRPRNTEIAALKEQPVDRGGAATRSPRLPGKAVWIVVLVCLAGVMFFRSMTTVWDHALMNILTLILVFIQVMTLLGWFCFSSGYDRRIRVLVPVLLLAMVVPLVASLRIDATTGNLIPTDLRWRWSKRRRLRCNVRSTACSRRRCGQIRRATRTRRRSSCS